MKLHRTAPFLFSFLAVAGCREESVNPLPVATTPPTVSAPDGGGGAPVDPPEPKHLRDVALLNPFGAPADNLLADGDFELSITRHGTGQYGWRRIRQQQLIPLPAETGGICKSGLRCGRVSARDILISTGTTAAGDARHAASVWLKALDTPPDVEKPCELADVIMYKCGSAVEMDRLDPAAKPDEKGWCQFQKEVDSSKVAICMYIEVGEVDVLVDHAVLLPAPTSDAAPKPIPDPPFAKRPDARARMNAALDLLRRTRRFGAPPPDERLPLRDD